jgi:phosphate/sulfate permease
MEVFFIWLIFSVVIGAIASTRGRSYFGFFLISLVLSPLLGLVLVLVISDLNAEKINNKRHKEEHERQLESIRAIANSSTNTGKVESISVVSSVADELLKLADLKEKGILSDQEFQDQKRALLCTAR